MTHYGKAFTEDEVSMLAMVSPESCAAPGDIDMSQDWISCIEVGWHIDGAILLAWSALIVIHGSMTVETRTKRAEMKPGDMIILNVHREHRAYSPHLEAAFLLFYDFATKPSREFALECLRETRAYSRAIDSKQSVL